MQRIIFLITKRVFGKINKIVFEDATFSYDKLKLSFISSLSSRAWLILNMDHSILCILEFLAFGRR